MLTAFALATAVVVSYASGGDDAADLRFGSWYEADGVSLTGETTTPGTGGSNTGGGSSNTGSGGGSNSDPAAQDVCNAPIPISPDMVKCRRDGPGRPGDDATDPVTLSDIASFSPGPRVQQMEPNGWVIVDLPANIYSLTTTEIVPGQLLGMAADVRFTPIAWHWDYGDGSTATLPTAGTTWANQGLAEFDATPTSHIYRSKGAFTIRLNVTYTAEYRINGGTFTPIAGTLTLPANDLHITATGAKTVLVDRNCIQNPRGPGC